MVNKQLRFQKSCVRIRISGPASSDLVMAPGAPDSTPGAIGETSSIAARVPDVPAPASFAVFYTAI